jgi:SET domain-containing protein
MKIIITEDQLKSLVNINDFNYYVKESDTHGKGVFAKNNIKKGSEELGVVIEDSKNKIFLYSDLGRYTNHNNRSNLEIRKNGNKLYFVAYKDIKKGEELFLDYDYNPEEFQSSKQLNVDPLDQRCKVSKIKKGNLKYMIVC